MFTFCCVLSSFFFSPAVGLLSKSNVAMSSKARFAAAERMMTESKAPAIDKIITLLEEMYEVADQDNKKDKKEFDKFHCWITLAIHNKADSVEGGRLALAAIQAIIQEMIARIDQYHGEIAELEALIGTLKDRALALKRKREQEQEAFEALESDLSETVRLLKEAIAVLSKELLPGEGAAVIPTEAPATLLQIGQQVQRKHISQIQNEMEEDFLRFISALNHTHMHNAKEGSTDSKAARLFLAKGAALSQQLSKALPEILQGVGGAVPEIKSYNRKSGKILATLQTMLEQNERDLKIARNDENISLTEFVGLYGLTLDDLLEGYEGKDLKRVMLVNLIKHKALEDVLEERGVKILAEDMHVLATLTVEREVQQQAYDKRLEAREAEITSLTQAIQILSHDASRDNFMKTGYWNFMQLGSSTSHKALHERARREQVVHRLMRAAHESNDISLIEIAAAAKSKHVEFADVLQMLATTRTRLRNQKDEEYTYNKLCKRKLKVAYDEKKNLLGEREQMVQDKTVIDDKIKGYTETENSLIKEIADITEQMRAATDLRNGQHTDFTEEEEDQKKTIELLTTARSRLQEFYESEAAKAPTTFIQFTPPDVEDYLPQEIVHEDHCVEERYGCCDNDGKTPKIDAEGSNCNITKVGTIDDVSVRLEKGTGAISALATIITEAGQELLLIQSGESGALDAYNKFMSESQATKESKEFKLIEVRGDIAGEASLQASKEQELLTNKDALDAKDVEDRKSVV